MISNSTQPSTLRQATLTGLPFICAIPESGQVIEFARPNGMHLKRVLIDLEQGRFRYDIEPQAAGADPHILAETFFKSNEGQPEDKAPARLEISGLEVWRTRRVFFDGLKSMLIFDVLFLRVKDMTFKFQYMNTVADYPYGAPVFEQMIQSLRPA